MNILYTLGKNLLAFIAGTVLGILVTVVFFIMKLSTYTPNKDIGLGIIAIIPAAFIIYSFICGIVGGVLGIIVYNIFKH